MKLTATGLFWIGLLLALIAFALHETSPGKFRVTGLPVPGVFAICGVWWFITIMLDARWLDSRPMALRGLLTGFVLSLVALFLVALFPHSIRIYAGLSLPEVMAGVLAICGFWWFIATLPDVRRLEFRPTARWGLLAGYVLSLIALFLYALYFYDFRIPYLLSLELFLGAFAMCSFWRLILILTDVRWLELGLGDFFSWLDGIKQRALQTAILGTFLLMIDSQGSLLAYILLGAGWGTIFMLVVSSLVLRLSLWLRSLFTGWNTAPAAQAPPPPATQPPPAPAPAAPAPQPRVICSWCGYANPANSIYCSNGACLAPLSSGNRFCIHCGVQFPVNARFCPACGSSA